MSAFESLLSVYETVRGQHNHGACSHLITQFLCRFQEKSTVKSEQEKQKDVLIAERDTAQFDLNIAQAHSQALATQVDAARARTGAAEAHIQAMSEEQGGMLAKAHAMEREKVELEKALAIAKSDIKYVRVSQRKGYQSRDKERELVNKEMRWLICLSRWTSPTRASRGRCSPTRSGRSWLASSRCRLAPRPSSSRRRRAVRPRPLIFAELRGTSECGSESGAWWTRVCVSVSADFSFLQQNNSLTVFMYNTHTLW